MLVLGRKQGEDVIITTKDGREIVIRNCGTTRRGNVRLGIEAPKDMPIYRKEHLDQERPKVS